MTFTFVEGDKLVLLHPVQFIRVNLSRGGSFALHSLQSLRERLNILCDTEDEFMIAHINGAADQLSALRVRTGNN